MRIIVTLFLAILIIAGVTDCTPDTTSTAPASPSSNQTLTLGVHVVPSGTIYFTEIPDSVTQPGDSVEIRLAFTNFDTVARVMMGFPPEIKIESRNLPFTNNIVRTFTAGQEQLEFQPGESKEYVLTWDQKNDSGQPVPYGWYGIRVNLYSREVTDTRSMQGSEGQAARVLVIPPGGVMEKDIELDQSQAANGITVSLEKLEMKERGAALYIMCVPDDYKPEDELSWSGAGTDALYKTDDEGWKPAHKASFGTYFLEDGFRYIWDLDPIPQDAREIIFRIDRIGDREGPWEFKIPLDSDNAKNQSVTVSQLVSQANTYNGTTVTLDAFFFYGIMQINALADSVDLDSSGNGEVVPAGPQIKAGGNMYYDFWNRLYVQDGESTMFPEYFGKIKIIGNFGIDDISGEYRIDITSAEVLEWMPPPPQAGAETPAGNLQINISGFSDMALQGAEVVSFKQPDGQPELRGLTDDDGTVTFDDIKQGGYEFTVNLADHIPMNIKLTVTGGRTATPAFVMAHAGEAPDDFMSAPGLGPQYRANITAARRDGSYVVNPWPPIAGATVTLGALPDEFQVNYRDYIETGAGQTRNNMFIISQSGSRTDDAELEVTLTTIDLPADITVTQAWQWDHGKLSKTGLQIEIAPDVPAGEYGFEIGVQINGEDYGTVPCTIKVTES